VKRRWREAAGYAVGAACLIWVLHDVRLADLARDAARLDWRWLAAAVAFDILSYVAQGLRWRLLLAPAGRVSTLESTQAIYAGLFANEVLPLRVGELVRAYLVSRRIGKDLLAVLPSMAVERLFDGLWLAACAGVTAIVLPLPGMLTHAADVLGAAVLAAAAVFLWVVLRRGAAPRTRFLARLAVDLRAIAKDAPVWNALAVSLGQLVFQAGAFWFVAAAYGLPIGMWASVAVFLIVRLGTLVPNAPANVGTFQFFTVLGLQLFGVEKTAATGFSLVVFLALTLPLWLLGTVALSRSGTTLGAVRKELARRAG
jgi:uncharacterized membrane protein YbhN (UPF0104 family)